MLSIVAAVHTRSPAQADATVYIISPANGETVTSPVTVRFGLKNMGIAPASVDRENTGHHHLLIDTGLSPLGSPVPGDNQHHHFGKGQTEAELKLAPGTHTLQLLMGDAYHIPMTRRPSLNR